MSLTRKGFLATSRFGLGAAPGEMAIASADPSGWLRDQLQMVPALPDVQARQPHSSEWVKAYVDAFHEGVPAIVRLSRQRGRRMFVAEVDAHLVWLATSRHPFFDRLVLFWANHFTVSGKRYSVAPIAGGFMREAIRPHVLGRFEDMLIAATRHPAMLLYLNNVGSIGPNSPRGRRSDRGLNENLAREILELHTLGVNGGYGQADVIELARIITGWTISGLMRRRGGDGSFQYEARLHEPGARQLLGQAFPDGQEEQGIAALKFLARHKSTARFIATKLARHFIADDPPAETVAHLQNVYLQTGGDLRALYLALIELPQVWGAANTKIRTHVEYAVAASRALGIHPVPVQTLRASLFQMGQMPFMTPSPAGWPDESVHWMTPEALMRRADFATLMAGRMAADTDPTTFLAETIGPAVDDDARRQILRAPSSSDAIALTLASIPFHRR